MVSDMEARFWKDLDEGREVLFKAHGNSMRPLFPSGSVFVLRWIPLSQLTPGDLVLVSQGEFIRLHRLIHRPTLQEPGFITKGDSLEGIDMPVSPEEIKAKAIAVLWHGKSVSLQSLPMRVASRLLSNTSLSAGRFLALLRKIKYPVIWALL